MGNHRTGDNFKKFKDVHNFDMATMAYIFGSSMNRMSEAVNKREEPVTNKVLVRLLCLYEKHPETIPSPPPHANLKEFFEMLGFENNRKGHEEFGRLVGHSGTNIHRAINLDGETRRNLQCLLAACMKLDKDGKSIRSILDTIASELEE